MLVTLDSLAGDRDCEVLNQKYTTSSTGQSVSLVWEP